MVLLPDFFRGEWRVRDGWRPGGHGAGNLATGWVSGGSGHSAGNHTSEQLFSVEVPCYS